MVRCFRARLRAYFVTTETQVGGVLLFYGFAACRSGSVLKNMRYGRNRNSSKANRKDSTIRFFLFALLFRLNSKLSRCRNGARIGGSDSRLVRRHIRSGGLARRHGRCRLAFLLCGRSGIRLFWLVFFVLAVIVSHFVLRQAEMIGGDLVAPGCLGFGLFCLGFGFVAGGRQLRLRCAK